MKRRREAPELALVTELPEQINLELLNPLSPRHHPTASLET